VPKAQRYAHNRPFVLDLAQILKRLYKPEVGLRRAGDDSRTRLPTNDPLGPVSAIIDLDLPQHPAGGMGKKS